MDDVTDDKLRLDMTSDNPTIFDKRFELPLIDIDTEMMSIPEMEYQAEFSLPSNTFVTLIDQLKLFGETSAYRMLRRTNTIIFREYRFR